MKAKCAVLIFTVLAAAVIGSSASTRAQNNTPAAAAATANTPADTAATVLAKKVYMQLATIDRSLLTTEMNNALTSEQVASGVPQLKALGNPLSLTIAKKTSIAGGTAYQFAVKFPQEEHHIEMFLDAKGLVG